MTHAAVKYRRFLIPLLILCCGMVLRVIPVITTNFWEDELFTYAFSIQSDSVITQLLHPIDDRPPLYYGLTSLLVKIGTSEIFLRTPSIIASIISLIILFIVFSFYDKFIGISVLFFTTFSLFLIEQSWQFRDYSLLTLVSACTLLILYSIIHKIHKKQYVESTQYFLFGFFAVIGCMTNYLYIPFIMSMISAIAITQLHTNIQHKGNSVLLKLVFATIPSFCLSAIYLVRQSSVIVRTTGWIPHVNWTSFFGLIVTTFGFSNNFNEFPVRELYLEQQFFYGSIIVLVCIVGMVYAIRTTSRSAYTQFIAVCFITYILNISMVQIISSALDTSLFLYRTFTPAILAAIIGFSVLVTQFIKTIVNPHYQKVVTSILCTCYLLLFLNLYSTKFSVGTFTGDKPHKEVTEILTYIDQNINQHDQIIFFPSHYNTLYLPYYWRGRSTEYTTLLSQYLIHLYNNSAMPIPTVRPDARIFIIANRTIFDPMSGIYSQEYQRKNKWILDQLSKFCFAVPKRIYETHTFTIDTCEYMLTPAATKLVAP